VSAHEPNRRLELTPEQMRELGYRAVDMVVSHLATLRQQSVGRTAPRAELEKLLREPPPEHPAAPLDVLEALGRDVLPNTLHVNHPRFFGFIPSPGNYVSAVARTGRRPAASFALPHYPTSACMSKDDLRFPW